MKLSKPEREQIKQFVREGYWDIFKHFGDLLCEKIKEESSVKETEWETIKAVLTKEGKIQGIRDFLQGLFEQIND